MCGRCCQARPAGRKAGLASGSGWQVSPRIALITTLFLTINFYLGSFRRCGYGRRHPVCLAHPSTPFPSWPCSLSLTLTIPISSRSFLFPFLALGDSCRTAFVCRGRTCHVDDVTSLARVNTRDKITGRLHAWPSLKCPPSGATSSCSPPLPSLCHP